MSLIVRLLIAVTVVMPVVFFMVSWDLICEVVKSLRERNHYEGRFGK